MAIETKESKTLKIYLGNSENTAVTSTLNIPDPQHTDEITYGAISSILTPMFEGGGSGSYMTTSDGEELNIITGIAAVTVRTSTNVIYSKDENEAAVAAAALKTANVTEDA